MPNNRDGRVPIRNTSLEAPAVLSADLRLFEPQAHQQHMLIQSLGSRPVVTAVTTTTPRVPPLPQLDDAQPEDDASNVELPLPASQDMTKATNKQAPRKKRKAVTARQFDAARQKIH